MLPYHADMLEAIMTCISDEEVEILMVSERMNGDFLTMMKDTDAEFALQTLLDWKVPYLLICASKSSTPRRYATPTSSKAATVS